MIQVRNPNEALVGIFLILVAVLAFYLSWNLSSITDVGIGPGYVPKMFAIVQIVVGGALIVHSFLDQGEDMEAWQIRPLFFVLASVAFFAASIERMGLVISMIGLVLIGCLADRETRAREALILAVGIALGSTLVFVKALGLSIGIWPSIAWGN